MSVRLVSGNRICSDSGPRPDEVRLGSGPLGVMGWGYLANVPRLPQMHVKRDSEAPSARALREKDNCAFAFLFPVCTTVRICLLCEQAREVTGIPFS